MNNLIPQWLDLQSAVAYLTNKTKEEWAIPSLLELGRIGKVPMYAVMQEGTYIQYWETKDNQATLRQKEIADLLLITPQQIEQILKMYPAHGYELLIEAPLPNGCSYDLPEYMPILMRMESKGFSRGVVIKSHEAIRILGKELEGYLQAKPAKSAPEARKVKQDLSIRNEAIRQDAKNGLTYSQIKQKYGGLSKTRISEICNEEKKTIGGNQNVMANLAGRVIKG